MSRSKPELQLYRPGSGPLRKSVQECENKLDSGSNLNLNVYNRQYDNTNKFDLISSNINELSLSQSYREELGSTCSLTSDYKRSNRHKKFDRVLYDPKRVIDKEKSSGVLNHQSNNMQLGGGHRSESGRNQYDQSRYRGRDSKNTGGRSNNDGYNDNSNTSNKHSNRRGGHGNRNRYDHDSNDRRGNNEDSWRSYSPHRRDFRQGSEPRIMGVPSDANRVRDTRSVEPMGPPRWNQDKNHQKPPSGRRNSTISIGSDGMYQQKPSKPPPNFDSLPPRFKNKYFKNNGFNNVNKSSEEPWDGSSVTFQGSGNGNYQQPNSCIANRLQKPQMIQPMVGVGGGGGGGNQMRGGYMQNPQSWSQTLPNMRGRGRGRLRQGQDDLDMDRLCQQLSRTGTEQINMMNHQVQPRPMTPPQYSNVIRTPSNESLTRCQQSPSKDYSVKMDRMYRGLHTPPPHVTTPPDQFRRNSIPVESQQVHTPRAPSPNDLQQQHQQQKQQYQPQQQQQSLSSVKTTPEILDWSEEVEMYAEIEEGLSDAAITRSSSMNSLVDHSCNTHPSRDKKNRRRRNRRKGDGRNRPNKDSRDRSIDNGSRNQSQNSNRNNYSHNRSGYRSRDNSASRESFKVPEFRGDSQSRGGNQNRNNNEGHRHRRRRDSRDSSGERSRRNSFKESDNRNWRDEIRDRRTQDKEIIEPAKTSSCQAPGILVLPRGDTTATDSPRSPNLSVSNRHSSHNVQQANPVISSQQKQLFDHHNPDKPIVVQATSSRISVPDPTRLSTSDSSSSINVNNQGPNCVTDQFGNIRPPWYDPERSRTTTSKIHVDTEIADLQLQWLLKSGEICRDWDRAMAIRQFLQESLITWLRTEIKFCQTENVENYFWRILYYNIIEVLRKEDRPDHKEQSRQYLKQIIDEGTKYFETVLKELEKSYSFKIEDFLGSKSYPQPKGLGYVGLALVSAQKIYICLGDLARYKEQMNDQPSYGISRQYYLHAQQLNPKNGRPYYLLAVLANNARRKLDAVYYYMRSLMTSNPFQSAKESLTSLFDDIRKKYEQTERKRREEKAERAKLHMKERERNVPGGNSLRREIWIHPEGGRRVHWTSSAQAGILLDSDEEDISKLTSSEINKRFNISYLHVLGKLITKIGMETFQDAALQMLKEFRALLQHSPFPLISTRLLQLLALNMYAIESSKLKEPQIEPRCRSEVQECALVVSLQMFNIIVERCVSLLREQIDNIDHPLTRIVGDDLQVILPAIKVWCDWMLCNMAIWNPPPSCSDYKVGSQGDTWSRLAVLMNLLEKLDYEQLELVSVPEDGYEMIRLPEDAMLSGFTPLMWNPLEIRYVSKDADMEVAQICWRINRIYFFGTEILCGIDPPVLKLHKFDTGSEYISVVRTSQKGEENSYAQDLSSDSDILVESFSEDEDSDEPKMDVISPDITEATDDEIRGLLQRKEELKKRQLTQERHRARVQAILQQSVVSVEIEVKPRLLVPDTNCFIDYLSSLKKITEAQINAQPVYILSVPLVVFNELEGLARGGKTPTPSTRISIDPTHIAKVAEAAKYALEFLRSRNAAVRCYTSKGAVVPLYTHTLEEDFDQDVGIRNDDRILATSLSLCRGSNKDQHNEGEPRRLYREVVLLTDDRNLRVKALARDVPVREFSDFMKWAGLG